MMYTAGACAEL